MIRKQFARVVVSLTLVAFLTNLALVPFYDFGQCTRKCRWSLLGPKQLDNQTIHGIKQSPDRCDCLNSQGELVASQVDRYYEKFPVGFPYLERNKGVCGVSGNEYQTAGMSDELIINCGTCGDCSNVRDVALYRKYSQEMTRMLSQCAFIYLLIGETFARVCLRAQFGFTSGCENRFVDNYGCTVSHCYSECIVSNPLTGNDYQDLNACMLCDEMYCSPVFVSSAGANRRTSGTVTDVNRPADSICEHVNAL